MNTFLLLFNENFMKIFLCDQIHPWDKKAKEKTFLDFFSFLKKNLQKHFLMMQIYNKQLHYKTWKPSLDPFTTNKKIVNTKNFPQKN